MGAMPDRPGEFSRLVDDGRAREAFVLFLTHMEGRSLLDLAGDDLAVLDQACRRVLPDLFEHHTLWLANHPGRLRRTLELLTEAHRAGYRPAATLEQIAWLRCLLAISAAMRKDMDAAHEQMCLSREPDHDVPRPNGKLEESLRRMELLQGATANPLRALFGVYFQCLREAGHHEMANALEAQVGHLLERIAADETRPGVVWALFHDEKRELGFVRLIHAALSPRDSEDRGVVYARQGLDELHLASQEAAEAASRAAAGFLRDNGYPDGLDAWSVRWEISTLQGEPADAGRSYTGGSLGLPLAVAIVSACVAQPVPNDTAFTGALSAVSSEEGDLLAVDGVPAKLRQALAVGCRRIFVPAGNAPIIESSPALQHAVQGAGAEVCTVQRLDEACGRLFTQEGSGQPWDLLADTFREAWRIVRGGPGRRDGPSAQPDRHRLHVLLSTAFLAAILIMEGYKHYLAYAPEYPAAAAVLRTVASAAVVVALLLLGYGLILASLYHRKAWAWLASIALTGAGMAVAVLILGPMLPATTDISKLSDWPVWASLLKDVFVLWLFAWILLTNTFAVVVSLEHLADRHQYITARRCLSWDSALEGRMPIRAIAFPWSWAALGLFFVAVFLFVLEFLYYMNLREGLAAAYWEALLGLGRDMLLVAAAAEAMLFYKVAVASVRRLLA